MDYINEPRLERFICEFFIGKVLIYRDPVALPDTALEVTPWKWPPAGITHFIRFNPILRPALEHLKCDTIIQTLDLRYWLVFPTQDEAALFKLTHL
jgi:hypothetical protein